MSKDKEKELINQVLCEKKQIKLQEIKQMELYEENYALLENNSKYVGSVLNGMPNGLGKEYGEGFLYIGNFLDGKWHGKGTITKFITNRIEIEGEFIDGHFCGI
jgi:hypothetical protein